MNYDEAVLYFNTNKNSQRFNSSHIFDEKPNTLSIVNTDRLNNSKNNLVEKSLKDKTKLKKFKPRENILDDDYENQAFGYAMHDFRS